MLHAAPVGQDVAGPVRSEVAVTRKRRPRDDERATLAHRRQRRRRRQQLGEAVHVVHVVVASQVVAGRRADRLKDVRFTRVNNYDATSFHQLSFRKPTFRETSPITT